MIMTIAMLVKNENKSQLQKHMKKRVSCSGVEVLTPLIIINWFPYFNYVQELLLIIFRELLSKNTLQEATSSI